MPTTKRANGGNGKPRKKPFRTADTYRTRARARIYLKDPLALSRKGSLPVGYAFVGGDTSIAPGPTSSRFIVVDYDSSTDQVYAPAYPKPQRLVKWTGGHGERLIDFRAGRGTRCEVQINAWATAVDTLELFQQPIVLGREVPWAFNANRLRILPQAMYEPNAFYSRQTRALHFGYFRNRAGEDIKTALSHDIVAHETAHAILDGLRPYYLDAVNPDTAAFHEYVGDVAAMLSLFRQRDFVGQLDDVPDTEKSFFDLVTNLAPQVGHGIYGDADRSFIRTARNTKTYDDVLEVTDPHVRCQVLTGFAFDLFEAIYRLRKTPEVIERDEDELPNTFKQLVTTARHVTQILLRPLDLLPPGDLSFRQYASILLTNDERLHPADGLKYRKAIERLLRKRKLHPEQHEWDWEITFRVPEDRSLRERDIDMIRSSQVGAYRFLDANRKLFDIPKQRDFRVVGLATNRRELNYGYMAPPETILQYVWEENVRLPADVRNSGLEHVRLRSGGTLVLDESVNIVQWSPQNESPERRDAARLHVATLLKDDKVDLAPVHSIRSGRPVVATSDGAGGVRLMVNTAQMHRRRSEV